MKLLKGKVRESDWFSIYVCVNCRDRLSRNQVMYSRGVCPKCGYDSKSTVCNNRKVVLKEFKHHPWWMFWNKRYTYQAGDGFSRRWLDRSNLVRQVEAGDYTTKYSQPPLHRNSNSIAYRGSRF